MKRRRRDGERITAIDLENRQAVRSMPPRLYNLSFSVTLSCETIADLLNLIERFSVFPQSYPLIRAVGENRTRGYSWGWRSPPTVRGALNASEIAEGTGDLLVFDVEVYGDLRELSPLIRVIEIETDTQTGEDVLIVKE